MDRGHRPRARAGLLSIRIVYCRDPHGAGLKRLRSVVRPAASGRHAQQVHTDTDILRLLLYGETVKSTTAKKKPGSPIGPRVAASMAVLIDTIIPNSTDAPRRTLPSRPAVRRRAGASYSDRHPQGPIGAQAAIDPRSRRCARTASRAHMRQGEAVGCTPGPRTGRREGQAGRPRMLDGRHGGAVPGRDWGPLKLTVLAFLSRCTMALAFAVGADSYGPDGSPGERATDTSWLRTPVMLQLFVLVTRRGCRGNSPSRGPVLGLGLNYALRGPRSIEARC